jgi:peptide-methionine (S)-S-oxide reductase
MNMETITLGGGCFWCTQAIYKQIQGVLDVESGYCNGHLKNPGYEQVCRGDTGHAEVVRVTFDSDRVSLGQLLEVFFATHDPTCLNRQGADVGTQYRSGIYYSRSDHQKIAQACVAEINRLHLFGKPVVTEIQALDNYCPAEDYHQDYFEKNPNQGYCTFVVGPKVEKFQKTFRTLLRGPDEV